MPNSIPAEVTAEIEKYVEAYSHNVPWIKEKHLKDLARICQFGYSLGKAESTRDEHLKP